MIEDYTDGRDQIFAQFQTVLPDTTAIIGEFLRVVYQGTEATIQNGVLIQGKQPTDKFWARISLQTAMEQQSTLRADVGSVQKRRYTSNGLIFVQIFSPVNRVENYALATKLASLIKTAFRGKQTDGCIWFTNVRVQELPKEEAWFRLNVVSEYQYDEIG